MKSSEFVFTDTGVVVELQKVSPFVVTDANTLARKSRPKPPVRIVQEDGPLKGTEEVMDTDPEYIERLRLWERKANELIMRMQIRMGVKRIIEPANWQDLAADYRLQRELMTNELKALNPDHDPEPLPDDDQLVFILFVACGSAEGIKEFTNEITKRSYPAGENLEAAKESFRPDVQG